MSENPSSTPQGPIYPSQTSSLATISLVAGILSWTLAPTIGAIVAVVTGHMAKGEIRRSGGMLTGDGLATIGLILGYINLAASLLGICLVLLILAGVITSPLLCLPFANQIQVILGFLGS